MEIYDMKVNQLMNPVGFSLSPIRFSYKTLCPGAKMQRQARLCVYQETGDMFYDSGVLEELSSLSFSPDLHLAPRTRYLWDVWAKADNGEECTSPRAFFETGKEEETWRGQWICAAPQVKSACMRKQFSLPVKAVKARLYICGLGLYEAYVNGQKAGEEYLTPGCNDYSLWLQYQTYDVTSLLAKENELTVLLGDGWYKGRFGFKGHACLYGDTQALLCEMHITLEDGTETVICSDNSWTAEESKIRFASIYDGEIYDASYQAEKKDAVRLCEKAMPKPTARLSPPVKVMQRLRPLKLFTDQNGQTILDMGQNMTGYLSFRADGKRGHTYHCTYGEVMQDGSFYTGNLRTARQEYTYISDGQETWTRPHFTFYGFRYVKLEGFEMPQLDDFSGCVLYTEMAQTGFVTTNNEKVNRLAQNALWGQRGNFVDVPTDCPQRDERMGWTGDAQVFCATACYQMDAAAFYTKYMHDMALEQQADDGAVPHIVPSFDLKNKNPSCAWADVATIIPWTLYQFYGDKALLGQMYTNMTQWVEWLYHTDEATGGRRLWQTGFHYADWLALDALFPSSCTGGTEPFFIASCYYLYSTRLTAKAAHVLGKTEDEARYNGLAEEILAAIRKEYITATGRLSIGTQTALILTLMLDIMPKEHVPRLLAMLDKLFEDAHGELRTGFVGTAYLCRVLTQNGFGHLAYSLFLREDYPGWLYEVNMGATTIWERWNSILPDGHVSSTGMNSLNHYAYGAVMEWVYGCVSGIAPCEDAPGFQKACMCPHPDSRLPMVDFTYDSPMGRYRSCTEVTGERTFTWRITVPFGAQARLVLPEGQVDGILIWKKENGRMTSLADAGEYEFHVSCDTSPWAVPLMDQPFAVLLANEKIAPALRAAAPHLAWVFAEKPAETLTMRALRGYNLSKLPEEELYRLTQLMNELSFGKKSEE